MLARKLGPFTTMQVIVLAVAFAAAAGGSYTVMRYTDGGSADAISADEQLVPVQVGDLITTVSTDGSLVFPISELVVFESSGVIAEVLVEEGDVVTEGQAIAALDPASVVALKEAVARARLDLQKARESLAEAEADPDPLEVAKAEATLAEALAKLEQEQDDRDALGAAPEPSEIAEAASALAKAALAVQSAEDVLADLNSGPTPAAIADAGSAIAAAATELANAERSRAIVVVDGNAASATAQDDLGAALDAYRHVFVRWLGVDESLVDPTATPADLLAEWKVDLDVLYDDSTETLPLAFRIIPPRDDPDTVWHEPTIYSYFAFAPGGVAGTCDDGPAPTPFTCVLLEFDTAWETLEQERANVDAVALDTAKDIAKADSAVAGAENSLEAAQEELADLTEDADPLKIGVAEADLTVARSKFDDANAALAELTDPAGPSAVALAAAEAAVARAHVDVESARDALAELTGEPDPLALALLRTEAEASEFALEAALSALDGATLRAAIGGEVISVDIESGADSRGGQGANQQALGILITDRSIVEIEGTVDEIDILAIDVNVAADVTMVALPGETLNGFVTEIGSPTNQQGVVSFPVWVRLEVPEGLELIEGLTATASIVTSEIRNVLLAPTSAIQGSFVQPFVRVVNGETVEERPVELGAGDDFWVVVRSGIAEGEQVAMPAPEFGSGFGSFPSGFGSGAALRALQGGGGGRGRGRN